MTVEMIFGKEKRKVPVFKLKYGGYFYWSPFAGERKKIFIPSTVDLKKRRDMDHRLARSRRCPEREEKRLCIDTPGETGQISGV